MLGHEMLKAHSAVVGNAVIEKVANFNFVLKAQVVGLNQMARNIPELQAIGPQLAAALLSNSEADTFSDEVLDFVNNISAEAPAARVKESTVVQLLDAAKAWIKRIHGDAPFKKWSYHKPTAAETAREQVVAMRGVIQDIDGLLQVGLLQTPAHVRSIEFEMGRCYMFKDDPEAVLQALCTIAKSSGRFQVMSEMLSARLTERAEDIAAQVVGLHLGTGTYINDVLDVVAVLPRSSILLRRIVYRVCTTMSVPTRTNQAVPPHLESIIRRHEQWIHAVDVVGGRPDEWDAMEPIGPMLAQVRNTVSAVAEAVTKKSITLSEMHVVIRGSSAFFKICEKFGISRTTQGTVQARKVALQEFDTMLKQTQCFVSFFCSCGVPIDAENLRSRVQTITVSYNTMPFEAIATKFDGVKCATSIPWLSELQSSELFLATWRQVGIRVCGDIRRAFEAGPSNEDVAVMLTLFRRESSADVLTGRAAPAAGDVHVGMRVMNLVANSPAGVRDFEQGEVVAINFDAAGVQAADIQWDIAGAAPAPTNVGEINKQFTAMHMMEKLARALQAFRDAPDTTRMESFRTALSGNGGGGAAAGAAAGAFGGGGGAAGDDDGQEKPIVLSQQQVASSLIPAVQNEWANLFRSVRWRTIKTVGLGRQFGMLKTKKRRAAEVRLLLRTGMGNAISGGGGGAAAAGAGGAAGAGAGAGAGSAPEECPICLDLLTQETTATLVTEAGEYACRHYIHPQCAAALEDKLCPICRIPFVDTSLMPTDADVLVSIEDFILSMRLRRWIPALLHVRRSMGRLCELNEGDDAWMTQVGTFHDMLEADWDQQSLGSISGLVEPVRAVFESFTPGHLDFFAQLSEDDDLVDWLLEHSDTSAFNRLLQVCRPRTDDPRLLKAIASLVEVRTLMIDMLYVEGAGE